MLIVLSGRSGAGKTTVARALARQLDAVHVRIDSIEQAIRASGVVVRSMDDAGYRAGYALAEDNLRLGRTVIADSVNPWPETRDAWRAVAARSGVPLLDVEIVCSDVDEHRRRVETRTTDIDGLTLPTWPDVVLRDYRPWDRDRLVVDTATVTVDDAACAIRAAIVTARWGSARHAILITGSMGAGKTTILGEASDLLASRGVVHAAIDADGFANGWLPAAASRGLLYGNLRATCEHYMSAGVQRFLFAEAIETADHVDRVRDVLGRPQLVVCRLTAPLETMQQRVRGREPGLLQQRFVDRCAELERILDTAAVEDFSIANHDRPVTDVANELLARAGWA
jgi:predicted kinase